MLRIFNVALPGSLISPGRPSRGRRQIKLDRSPVKPDRDLGRISRPFQAFKAPFVDPNLLSGLDQCRLTPYSINHLLLTTLVFQPGFHQKDKPP